MTIISGFVTFGLLVVLCKAINDILFVLARKHQDSNGMAWALSHSPWTRWSVGGIVGMAAGYVMMTAFLEANRPIEPCTSSVQNNAQNAQVTNCVEILVPRSEEDEDPNNRYDMLQEAMQLEVARWAAATLWIEARGETTKGRMAVAEVIWNRAGKDPSNIIEVVKGTNWTGATPINPNTVDISDRAYRECWDIGCRLASGEFESRRPWTHFYNPQLAKPMWGRQLVAKARVGRHMFGRLP